MSLLLPVAVIGGIVFLWIVMLKAMLKEANDWDEMEEAINRRAEAHEI